MDEPSSLGSGADRTILESYLEMGKNYRRNKHKLLEEETVFAFAYSVRSGGSLFIYFSIYSTQLPSLALSTPVRGNQG